MENQIPNNTSNENITQSISEKGLIPNLEITRKFLTILDEQAEIFTFQIIQKNKDAKLPLKQFMVIYPIYLRFLLNLIKVELEFLSALIKPMVKDEKLKISPAEELFSLILIKDRLVRFLKNPLFILIS